MSTSAGQEPPEEPNHSFWRALLFPVLLVISICIIVLYVINLLLATICTAIFLIVGTIISLLQIEGARGFLGKCLRDSFYYLERLPIFGLQCLKKLVVFLEETRKLVLIGLAVLLVIGPGIGVIIWFILPQDPFDPIQITNDEYIGISMGRTVFDINQVDYSFKADAAQAYQNKDYNRAKAYWDLAIRENEMDAEAAIYKEDQLVQDSGRPYITIVVLASLSGDDHTAILTGRDIVQGAYTAQAEYNGNLPAHSDLPSHNDSDHKLPNGYLLRLIIANVGTSSPTDTQVAQCIVQVWKADQTIVGVTGQFTNEDATIQELKTASIPMISSTQLAGDLVGVPYLLSVTPSLEQEGMVAADYACSITHDHIAIFYGPSDSSSNQLEQAFDNEFANCGGTVNPYPYSLGDKQTLEQLLNQVLSADHNLKLIYLPDASPNDAKTLLTSIQRQGSQAQILGSNTFYQFVHLAESGNYFAGISYTTFAFHDEWNLPQVPWLLKDYPIIFNAQKQHQHSLYGVQIPDSDVILAYDATDMLAGVSGKFLGNGQSKVTRPFDALWKKLETTDSFQGFSGCLAFDSNGQPVNKAVVVLQIQADGTNYVAYQQGRYKC